MVSVSAGENSVVYSDVPQSAWGAMGAFLCSKSKQKVCVCVMPTSSDCDFYYARLDYFLKISKEMYRLKVLPAEFSDNISDAETLRAHGRAKRNVGGGRHAGEDHNTYLA